MILPLLSVAAASAKAGINVPCAGQASLVAAINEANSAGGGTISLARNCRYKLTVPDNGENGLPVITTPITVIGHQATINGTGAVRVFEVDGPGGNLSLSNLTIKGGFAADFGGGIANLGGDVSLDDSQVTNNSADAAGGGIASATFDPSSPAQLTLHNSSVTDNQQSGQGDQALGGGGIANIDGTATLYHSQVNGNSAQGFVGGGIASGDYFGSGGESVLTLDQSQVKFNTAPNAGGGGIQNLLGSLTLNHSQVNRNTSLNGGGIASGNQGNPSGVAELHVNHSQVNFNTATAGPGGEGPPVAAGGIANGSDAVIDHSQVDNNKAPNGIGAGIVNHGMMTVSDSEVNRNVASGSDFAGSGGGILNAQGPPGTTPSVLTVTHSKVNHNSAAGGYGGGIANGVPLPPGPPPLFGGTLTLKHSQVKANNAAHGGGIFNNQGTITLQATMVIRNHVDNCEPLNSIAGCTG